MKKRAQYGTARLVADATGYSIHYVRQVMQGVRTNATIELALKKCHKTAVKAIKQQIA